MQSAAQRLMMYFRRDYVVMGGVEYEGDWNKESDEKDANNILQGCIKLMPSLQVFTL